MANHDSRNKPKGTAGYTDWAAPIEDLATSAAAAAAGAAAGGPIAGIAAGAGMKLVTSMVRGFAKSRAEKRTLSFEQEVEAALAADPTVLIEKYAEDERFAEIIFQNYRRSMDALAREVVPALARLTAMYRDREPDDFFRGVGRLLQDLSAEEFYSLRVILSATEHVNKPIVGITPWRGISQRYEMRLHPAHSLRRIDPKFKEDDGILGIDAPPCLNRLLWLLDHHGLCHSPERSGMDLAMTGTTELEMETVRRLLTLVEPADVHPFPSSFDRAND